jgi:hypothetical protein
MNGHQAEKKNLSTLIIHDTGMVQEAGCACPRMAIRAGAPRICPDFSRQDRNRLLRWRCSSLPPGTTREYKCILWSCLIVGPDPRSGRSWRDDCSRHSTSREAKASPTHSSLPRLRRHYSGERAYKFLCKALVLVLLNHVRKPVTHFQR